MGGRQQTGSEAAEWLEQALKSRPPKKIFAPGREHIGDIVNLTGPLMGLRERFPSAKIVAEVGEGTAGLLSGFAAVDEVWLRPRRQGLAGKVRHILRLRREKFDLAAILDDANSHIVQTWLGGIPLRVGIWRGKKHQALYSAYTPLTLDRHDVRDHGEAVLHLLGLPPGRCQPRLFPSPRQKEEARSLAVSLGLRTPSVAVQPGASDARKRWDEDRFASLIRSLNQAGCQVCLVGGPGEEELVRRVKEKSGGEAILVPPQEDLLVLGSFLAQRDLVITNDSGPMHLNAVMGGRGLALYGPTEASHTSPFGDCLVLQKPCPCSPRHWTTCPGSCLADLTVEEVTRAALSLLAQGAGP